MALSTHPFNRVDFKPVQSVWRIENALGRGLRKEANGITPRLNSEFVVSVIEGPLKIEGAYSHGNCLDRSSQVRPRSLRVLHPRNLGFKENLDETLNLLRDNRFIVLVRQYEVLEVARRTAHTAVFRW
ncbi:hypothetical protein HO173_011234 [Letharia columbiana]|uniref:Uncharacterized protein n=1 Tax=Letharia columbiana TaxID=112416 RepID=A0A8H6FJR6_9LECA|nr:uncharacterized protein HO173_011234 [Letharia columbiana]KAF6229804.1 hypothetical protein HO173_011234 [Letharia columbiana]